MVKTIVSILASLLLLAAAFVFEYKFIGDRFETLEAALETLEDKVRSGSAVRSDAEAVRQLWEEEKKQLHVVVPHGDIAYIDYWLGEAVSYIETQDFDDALSKIVVLLTICEQVPQTYGITFGNIF